MRFNLKQECNMNVLKINGKDKQFEDDKMPSSLADLLQHLRVDSATVVAELDGLIIERANFTNTLLKNGQSIELVRFVPGG
jgi:thiamine biosynthesis protein ThiS